ncbi:MAG: hypothetical protein QOE90_3324 [Thermoplasmata archaeon]|jgi:hypothetical protein|nr:hypothetical protein [Thermoplasmata archaeon]
MSSTPPASSNAQLRALITIWTILATSAALDVLMTILAAQSIPGFREENAIARIALHAGLLPFLLLKAAGLAFSLLAALYLLRHGYAVKVERLLTAWCILYGTLNAMSAFELLGGL